MSKVSEYRTEVRYECDACGEKGVAVTLNLNTAVTPELPTDWTAVTVLKNIDGRLSQETTHYCKNCKPIITATLTS